MTTMDSRTGDLFPTREAALKAGVPEPVIVELFGPKRAVSSVAKAVKAQRKKDRKSARAARRRNR